MIWLIRNLLLTSLLMGIITYAVCRKAPDVRRRVTVMAVMSILTLMVFWLTGLSPKSGFHPELDMTRIQMIPFKGIKTVLYYGVNLYAIENILGNTVMLLPLCFLLPACFRPLRRWYFVTVIGMALSFLIELSQLFLARGTDIDDIILNTLGALLGYWMWKLVWLIKKPKETGETPKGWNLLWIPAILIPYSIEILMGFADRCFEWM